MKLREHAAHIGNLMKQGFGDMDIICSSDNEGNSFGYVHYTPSVGFFDGDSFNIDDEDLKEEGTKPNVVCIN